MLRGVIINGQQQVLKKFLIIPLKRIISLQKSDAFLVLRAQLANIVYDQKFGLYLLFKLSRPKNN